MSNSIKFFVSYKYKDSDVYADFVNEYELEEDTNYLYTPRHYVDKIIDVVGEDNVYKGEKSDESMEHLADDTIDSKLKEKIFDSSVTVVLVSPNMWDKSQPESGQWIPNEITYSLRDGKRRGDRVSKTNGILAVILPNKLGNYDHAFTYQNCGVRTWRTDRFFRIIEKNMFNRREEKQNMCHHCSSHHHYGDDHSYMHPVKWEDFIQNHNKYLEHAIVLRDSEEEFNLTKTHE